MQKLQGVLAGILNNPYDSILISETDAQGKIIHANDNFCAISGYTHDELVGSPHSIIRHPSMPKELFRFLWSTIEKGKVFRGIIKNKKKDGSHYWVNATIIPVFENGKITRFIGGRSFISDDKLAEQLFKEESERYKLFSELESREHQTKKNKEKRQPI